MCGIVAATSKHRNIVPLLVQGLKRLEYRGYDSCGVAVWDQGLKRVRGSEGFYGHRPYSLGHTRRTRCL